MKVYSEDRPWGMFEKFNENKACTVKLIHVKPNSRLSLQYHSKRSEFWRVIRGKAIVQLDNDSIVLNEGGMITIPRKAKHRLGAPESGCTVLEIAYGKFDEKDIVRVEDDYNRRVSIPPAKARASAAG